MAKISIIVPVYNCRAYLERCVASILGQTFEDIQLLLIDDGSTDGSGALCDEFAVRDSRVQVIHQENRGVSAARNAGLDAARGDYISFVDADDWAAPEMLKEALARLGDGEMVLFDAVTVWPDGREEDDTIPLLPDSAALDHGAMTPPVLAQTAGAVWRCLYRRDLVEGVRFVEGLKMSEDRLFNLETMGRANSVRYLKKGLYCRFMRPGSACNRYHGDKLSQNLLAYSRAKAVIRDLWAEEYLPLYARMLVTGGALDAVYEVCSSGFHGDRLAAIREITEEPALAEAFRLSPPKTIREKLLAGKHHVCLLAVGMLVSMKNRSR